MIINLRKRFELAVGKVITESFSDGPEDVSWWVGLGQVNLGECETCGGEVIKPCASIHINIIDHEDERLCEINADMPTLLTPGDIRKATRELVDGYRIDALENRLADHDHDHESES